LTVKSRFRSKKRGGTRTRNVGVKRGLASVKKLKKKFHRNTERRQGGEEKRKNVTISITQAEEEGLGPLLYMAERNEMKECVNWEKNEKKSRHSAARGQTRKQENQEM